MKYSTEIAYEYRHFGPELAFEKIRSIGYDCVDYNMPFYNADKPNKDIYNTSLTEFENYFQRDRKLAENAGIEIYQTHAPYHTWSKDPELYACRIEEMTYSILATALLGSKYMVLHPAQPNWFLPDPDPAGTREINFALFSQLIPVAEKYDVYLALENMPTAGVPTATPDSLIDYIDMMESDRMVACLDTGHANLTGGFETTIGENIAEYVRKLGPRLKALHVNDNCGRLDEHYIPFLGTIPNWKEFMDALRAIGYTGTLNMESGSFVAKLPEEFWLEAKTLSFKSLKKLGEL